MKRRHGSPRRRPPLVGSFVKAVSSLELNTVGRGGGTVRCLRSGSVGVHAGSCVHRTVRGGASGRRSVRSLIDRPTDYCADLDLSYSKEALTPFIDHIKRHSNQNKKRALTVIGPREPQQDEEECMKQ